MYKQPHTPNVVQGGSGRWNLPWDFAALGYLETSLLSVESLWCLLQDKLKNEGIAIKSHWCGPVA